MDAITAAFERNLERFRNRFGVVISDLASNNPKQEIDVANVAVKQAESEQRGSNNMTQNDAGDYGTAAEALSAQKSEVKGAAPEGTEQRGATNSSANYKDKNYTLNGSSARLAAVATAESVRQLVEAGRTDEAAGLLRRIAVDGGSDGMMDGAGAGADVGTPIGGKPESVEQNEAPVDAGAAALPPADAPTGGNDAGSNLMAAEIQRKLNELAESKKVTTEVMTQLEDVLKSEGVTAAVAKEMISKMAKHAAAMASIKSAGEFPPSAAPVGDKPAPVAPKVAPPVVQKAAPQSSGNPGVPATGQASRPGPGGTGAVQAQKRQAASAETKNESIIKPANMPPSTMQDQGEDRYDLADGDPDESIRRQANQQAPADDKTNIGQELHDAGDYKLGEKQAGGDEVDWKLYDELDGKTASTKQAETDLADQTEQAGGDEDSRYEKSLQGDTAEDEISDGNVDALNGPETTKVVGEARKSLDRNHDLQTRGSTVAMAQNFKPQDRKAVEARLRAFEAANQSLNKAAKLLVERKTASKGPAIKATRDIVLAFRQTEEAIKTVLSGPADATKFANVMAKIPALIRQAESTIGFIESIVQTEKVAIAKLNRVGPAFKLATKQHEWGQIRSTDELHQKIADYMRMPGEAFDAVSKTAQQIGDVSIRSGRPGMRRDAVRRMPSVVTASPADMRMGEDQELEHLFDD